MVTAAAAADSADSVAAAMRPGVSGAAVTESGLRRDGLRRGPQARRGVRCCQKTRENPRARPAAVAKAGDPPIFPVRS
jgi:hypothetical protein